MVDNKVSQVAKGMEILVFLSQQENCPTVNEVKEKFGSDVYESTLKRLEKERKIEISHGLCILTEEGEGVVDGLEPAKESVEEPVVEDGLIYLTPRQAEVYDFSKKEFGINNSFEKPTTLVVGSSKIYGGEVEALDRQGCWLVEKTKKKGQTILRVTVLSREYKVVDDPKKLTRLRNFGKTPEMVEAAMQEVHSEKAKYNFVEVNLDDLLPPPVKLRMDISEDGLEQLKDSLKEDGVLQPIIVRPWEGGYQVIAGDRRAQSARKAGFITIPAVVRTLSDEEAVRIALVENIQRENLSCIEEAEIFQKVINAYGYIHEELAERIGKPKTYVSERMALLHLDEAIKILIHQGKISISKATYLCRIQDPDERLGIAEQIAKDTKSMPDYKLRSILNNRQGRSGRLPTIRFNLERVRKDIRSVNLSSLDPRDASGLLFSVNDTLEALTGVKKKLEAMGVKPKRYASRTVEDKH